MPLTYVYSDQDSYDPLARIDGVDAPEIFWFHCQPNGTPERMTDSEGQVRWEGVNSAWGKLLRESETQVSGYSQNLRMQGQYLDRETGLHYNLFRYYDPDCGRFTQQDPIGLAGGINLYQYAPNALGWVDPWGLSCRKKFMGRTPGKNSKTGREVIARMRGEGRIRGTGDRMQFKSSTDGKWYRIQDADMAHLTDAVKYWNQKGGYYGPKSREVRAFMRDSRNYELEYYGHNRSQGALLPDRYKDSADFIGPQEKSQYFQ